MYSWFKYSQIIQNPAYRMWYIHTGHIPTYSLTTCLIITIIIIVIIIGS
jgi:hypothetical protein